MTGVPNLHEAQYCLGFPRFNNNNNNGPENNIITVDVTIWGVSSRRPLKGENNINNDFSVIGVIV